MAALWTRTLIQIESCHWTANVLSAWCEYFHRLKSHQIDGVEANPWILYLEEYDLI